MAKIRRSRGCRRWFYPILFLGVASFIFFYTRSPRSSPRGVAEMWPKSIYDITVKDIRKNDVSLNTFKGKVLLIVNVASKCGLTKSNYRELNVLYRRYRGQGLEILAFPCNQFGGQEPGSNKEIESTCKILEAEFPIFDKIEVNGANSATLYKFLKAQKGGRMGDSIKWNFTKFLVDKDGKVIERYAPTTSPFSIEEDIKKLLSI